MLSLSLLNRLVIGGSDGTASVQRCDIATSAGELVLGCLARAPFYANLLSQLSFELMQVFRVGRCVANDKCFHFSCYSSLNLHLLNVADVTPHGVLPKEVADQDLLHLGLFAKARCCLRIEQTATVTCRLALT